MKLVAVVGQLPDKAVSLFFSTKAAMLASLVSDNQNKSHKRNS
jgi:hypothetical protein